MFLIIFPITYLVITSFKHSTEFFMIFMFFRILQPKASNFTPVFSKKPAKRKVISSHCNSFSNTTCKNSQVVFSNAISNSPFPSAGALICLSLEGLLGHRRASDPLLLLVFPFLLSAEQPVLH